MTPLFNHYTPAQHQSMRRLFGGYNAAPADVPALDPDAFEHWAVVNGLSQAPPDLYRALRHAFDGGAEWAATAVQEELAR